MSECGNECSLLRWRVVCCRECFHELEEIDCFVLCAVECGVWRGRETSSVEVVRELVADVGLWWCGLCDLFCERNCWIWVEEVVEC